MYKEMLKNASRQLNAVMQDLLSLANIAKQLENGIVENSRKLAELTTEMHEASKDKKR